VPFVVTDVEFMIEFVVVLVKVAYGGRVEFTGGEVSFGVMLLGAVPMG
jgi:hypothetical protein